MRGYRLKFWGTTGLRESTLPLKADTDWDACEAGSKMLIRSDCATLEVWRDTYLLARIDRDGAPIPVI
ncbi:MAG: hypothetical protein QOF03_110 [Alphaproteobacteria bacterium]|jgi:hypothetical protein|nr:hypothetical protein [Alphaproteobacteria bacterium]